ncbi:oxidoreductase [Penicillium tannophilum]|nr:oxidoreductase [Penicillium tannophilum]
MSPRASYISLGNMGRILFSPSKGQYKTKLTTCFQSVANDQEHRDTPLTVYNRTASRAVFCAQNPNTKAASNLEESITTRDIISICIGDDVAFPK